MGSSMKADKKTHVTQIRFPEPLAAYIHEEAESLGIAQNSVMIMLMYDGIRFREEKNIHPALPLTITRMAKKYPPQEG